MLSLPVLGSIPFFTRSFNCLVKVKCEYEEGLEWPYRICRKGLRVRVADQTKVFWGNATSYRSSQAKFAGLERLCLLRLWEVSYGDRNGEGQVSIQASAAPEDTEAGQDARHWTAMASARREPARTRNGHGIGLVWLAVRQCGGSGRGTFEE